MRNIPKGQKEQRRFVVVLYALRPKYYICFILSLVRQNPNLVSRVCECQKQYAYKSNVSAMQIHSKCQI
jgi:hypothetical protein